MTRIPIAVNIIIILLPILAGFAEGKRLWGKYNGDTLENVLKKVPHLYILIPLFLIFFSTNILIQKYDHIVWYLPLWLQYYYSAVTWSGILVFFAFMFSLVLTLSFKMQHRERWKIAITAILFVLTLQTIQYVLTKPIAATLYDKRGYGNIILQSSSSSCAAASAANILARFGMEITEPEMAALFGTTSITGTTAAQIVYGLKHLDIKGKPVFQKQQPHIERLHPPAILFVDYAGFEDHAIAMLRIAANGIEIIDPMIGKNSLTKERLEKIWHGKAIEIHVP